MSNNLSAVFGTDDLGSPRAIREYLNRLRRAARVASNEIGDTAEQLETIISLSPGVGILLGADSRRRARYICEPLHEAANAANACAGLSVVTWQRFERKYGEVLDQARSGKPGRKQIKWDDQ